MIMNDELMILNLQKRFGLSEVQANVIFYHLQKHFTKNNQESRGESSDSQDGN